VISTRSLRLIVRLEAYGTQILGHGVKSGNLTSKSQDGDKTAIFADSCPHDGGRSKTSLGARLTFSKHYLDTTTTRAVPFTGVSHDGLNISIDPCSVKFTLKRTNRSGEACRGSRNALTFYWHICCCSLAHFTPPCAWSSASKPGP
jgi:hypothetical protein